MPTPAELDAERIFAVLASHDVDYVVIGGFAGVLHGLARATDDVDVTPAGDAGNLRRLAAALDELDAKLLAPGAEEPIEWPWSEESLRSFTNIATRTSAGDLDICLRPDAPGGRTYTYDELADRAIVVSLAVDVPVAALEDVIASKEASDRDKDRRALPELRDLLLYLRSQRDG